MVYKCAIAITVTLLILCFIYECFLHRMERNLHSSLPQQFKIYIYILKKVTAFETRHCKMAQCIKWSNHWRHVITTGYVTINHCPIAASISSNSYSGIVFIQLQYCWAVKLSPTREGPKTMSPMIPAQTFRQKWLWSPCSWLA